METCIKKVREMPTDFKDIKSDAGSNTDIAMTLSPIDLSVLAN